MKATYAKGKDEIKNFWQNRVQDFGKKMKATEAKGEDEGNSVCKMTKFLLLLKE